MAESEYRQRLLAVLAADVAGYSRMMAADPQATVAALDAARKVFAHQVQFSRGRVVDMAGDSVLAVFETATGAVTAALAIQRELGASAARASENHRMCFRIGVHLGEVIEKADGTVYGDGVNIAARLEGLAEPAGVTVSEAVHGAVRGKVIATFVDQGEQTVKNIPDPIRSYQLQTVAFASKTSSPDSTLPPVAPRTPSIAVLPFKVLAEDLRLGFLADGLVEDVIALLARVAGFLVISQSSCFAFRSRNESLPAIARQLGVRYVVEGSLRPISEGVRVSTQLVDADSGRVLWTGRLERAHEDTADLQETIARGIISELEPELTRAEIALIRRQRPENVGAWGSYRQAIGATALKGWSAAAIDEARTHLLRACEIDPAFGLARAQFAVLTALAINTGLLQDSPAHADQARDAAEQAILLDDGSSEVLGFAGCALCDVGYRDRGSEILERALEIDPSNAQAHVAMGATIALIGQFDTGIDKMRYGMRISPHDRRLGFWGWALGLFLLRASRPEEALLEARASAKRDPKLHLARILEAAAAQALARSDEARGALAAARNLHPTLSLEEVARSHGRRVAAQIGTLWEK